MTRTFTLPAARWTRGASEPRPAVCVFVESPGWKTHSCQIWLHIYGQSLTRSPRVASRSAARVLFVSGGFGGVWEECFVFPLFVFVWDVCVSPGSRNLSWRSPAPATNQNESLCYSGVINPWSEYIFLIPSLGLVTAVNRFIGWHTLFENTVLGNGMFNGSFQNAVCQYPW